MVKAFFRKLFGLDRAELEAKLSWAKAEIYAQSEMIKMLNVRLAEQTEAMMKQADELAKYRPYKQHWVSVTGDQVKSNKLYWVVSQGGFYEIRGYRLLTGSFSQITMFALRNGFVVETREEAQSLSDAMRALVGRV